MTALRSPRIAAASPLAREQKFLPAPLALVADDGIFEGYASLFGVPDLGRDVVAPGAFRASLQARGAGGIRMLWQHDPNEPIGLWLGLAEDQRGLRVRGRLNLAVARAREIHALMREGAIDGLSIGFRVEQAFRERATGLRRLQKLDLWEISLVTFPMLPQARVGQGGPLILRRTGASRRPAPSSVLSLRAKLDELRLDLSALRLGRLLRRKYRPDQPRVPAGTTGGG